ncbi:DUF4476 domain-containing protein [Flaviaesturariibacter terrae]
MRTIFTLLLAISFSSSFAHYYDEGRLTVTFAGITNLVVQVDNRYYTPSDNVVYIDHVPAGRHSIRVFSRRNGNGNGGGRNVLFSTQVQVKPYTHVDVMINRFGRAYVDERRLNGNVYTDYDQWGNGGYPDNSGWNDNDWNNGNGGGNNNSGGWGNGGNGNNGGYGNGGYNNGGYGTMSASNFTALLQQLHNENFDNTRLSLVKNALASNRVTAAQVKQLMQQFSFDNDRLEVAKTAYPRTTDRNNFFQVMDAFEFSSSKESLTAWMRTQNP